MIALLLIEVIALVTLSAVCSGLNVALMSLDIADLKRKKKLGSVSAARVLPLRINGHLSLASILLTNVAVISATSLVIGNQFNGLVAEVTSTLLIVVFGEVFPQAIFVSKALAFTSRFAGVLRAMIFVTYPVSKLLQLLLDKLIEKPKRELQSRQELGLMITEHIGDDGSELDEDEIEIMRGALSLSEKHVRDIMTPLSQVFWLAPDEVIDAAKIDEIKAAGWSRIPVFNRRHTRCFGVLLMKDLVDIDFDNYSYRVSELRLYSSKVVGSMTALDTMFRKFINAKTHLIPVERDEHIAGIVTIEDVIEEIVGHEIEDETDRSHRR